MNLNDLDKMYKIACCKKEDMELQLKRICMLKEVLYRISTFLKVAQMKNKKIVVYRKFLKKESYGSYGFVNRYFEQQYSEFMDVCNLIEELCGELGFVYQVQVYDDDKYEMNTLSRGVTIEQVFHISSLELIDCNEFSNTLDSIIQKKFHL